MLSEADYMRCAEIYMDMVFRVAFGYTDPATIPYEKGHWHNGLLPMARNYLITLQLSFRRVWIMTMGILVPNLTV